MILNTVPIVKTEMLIRKPIEQVFNAFIDPELTTQFWFSKSSGRLEEGKTVVWEWTMFGASARVSVKAVEENKRILIEWGEGETSTTVEWLFKSLSDDTTFVSILNSGLKGTGDEVVANAMDSIGGFTMVLAGLKAFLEYDIRLNLVADRYPKDLLNL